MMARCNSNFNEEESQGQHAHPNQLQRRKERGKKKIDGHHFPRDKQRFFSKEHSITDRLEWSTSMSLQSINRTVNGNMNEYLKTIER